MGKGPCVRHSQHSRTSSDTVSWSGKKGATQSAPLKYTSDTVSSCDSPATQSAGGEGRSDTVSSSFPVDWIWKHCDEFDWMVLMTYLFFRDARHTERWLRLGR